jgi:DNA anti-recombination protein RmuC
MKAKLAAVTVSIALGALALVVSAFAQPPVSPPPIEVPAPPIRTLDYAPSNHGASSYYLAVELSRQTDDLVRQLHEAKTDADKDKIKAKLTEALEKQFDQRQKRHLSEIEDLEAQLKKLKELVQKRQESRRDIISKRLEQLQRDAEGLGW